MSDEASELARAAFGDQPGRWPLPTPVTAQQAWHRAVAAGGQGRYATALTDLDGLAGTPLASLALSTRASFLRQLGGHAVARGFDGRALALAGPLTEGHADARADALTGLAADALGVGRFALSARLLQRVDLASAAPRCAVRHAWVRAELAMATGDGAGAVGHARRAVELADGLGSTRHAVKSQVVLAAAHCCEGRIDTARVVADAAFDTARDLGMLPLSWALACLLGDVGSDVHPPADVVAWRERAAATITTRGGAWAVR